MISCEKAAKICSKSQYNEASFLEIVKLLTHKVICKTCVKFSSKNSKLTTLCDKATLHSLSDTDKEEMKKKIHTEL